MWLIKKKVKATFVTIPMFFMFTVTLSSLGIFAWQNFQNQVYVLSIISAVLFVLSVVLILFARQSLKRNKGLPSVSDEKRGNEKKADSKILN